MRSLKPDKDIHIQKIKIPCGHHKIPALVLSPKEKAANAPARLKDYSNLPPAYTFVGDGEPFYAETMEYIRHLKEEDIPAKVDVYHTNIHAFDMMNPELEISAIAAERFNRHFAYAKEHFFAPQGK